jgi:hypothetical protein
MVVTTGVASVVTVMVVVTAAVVAVVVTGSGVIVVVSGQSSKAPSLVFVERRTTAGSFSAEHSLVSDTNRFSIGEEITSRRSAFLPGGEQSFSPVWHGRGSVTVVIRPVQYFWVLVNVFV